MTIHHRAVTASRVVARGVSPIMDLSITWICCPKTRVIYCSLQNAKNTRRNGADILSAAKASSRYSFGGDAVCSVFGAIPAICECTKLQRREQVIEMMKWLYAYAGERVQRIGVGLARGETSVLPSSILIKATWSQPQEREHGKRNEGT